MAISVFRATADFNREVCGHDVPPIPTRLSPSRKQWTEHALNEEVYEFQQAETISEEVDALIDLIYFAAGRLYEMGVPGDVAFTHVHQANMKKQRGELSKRPGSMGHDAIKPAGWIAPGYDWLIFVKNGEY